MANVIPFETKQLPAYLQNNADAGINDTIVLGGVGFPVLSIKGKVWHLVENETRTLLTKGDSDEPLPSIEAVVVNVNPMLSKVYYAEGYVEGSNEKPDCFSNDGRKPDPSVEEPQNATCADCPNNAWGSKVSDQGVKSKACADSRRVALASQTDLKTAMLLRIPAASLKDFDLFIADVKKRSVPYTSVLTRIGFDYSVAHPKLTFKAIGFLDDAAYAEVMALRETDVVRQIIGTSPAEVRPPQGQAQIAAPKSAVDKLKPEPVAAPAPAPAATQEAKPAGRRGRPPKAATPVAAVAPVQVPVAVAPIAKPPSNVIQDVDGILADLGIDD